MNFNGLSQIISIYLFVHMKTNFEWRSHVSSFMDSDVIYSISKFCSIKTFNNFLNYEFWQNLDKNQKVRMITCEGRSPSQVIILILLIFIQFLTNFKIQEIIEIFDNTHFGSRIYHIRIHEWRNVRSSFKICFHVNNQINWNYLW